MAKRKRSVSLSFVLLRFAVVMLVCMLICFLVWFSRLTRLQNAGVVYRPIVSSQQVERILAENPAVFLSPGDDFLAEYAWFDENGELLESNVKGRKLEALAEIFRTERHDAYAARHTYADGSAAVFHWHYRAEFTSPALRARLPPFEYLWLATMGAALTLCLLLNILWLRRRLAAKLKLFTEVSEKVGAQVLDFAVPHAGIREYDQALAAMEQMRKTLYGSLSSQWAAQQRREAEIAALAHDLKTPLTLISGNAELLLEEDLPAGSRKMAETIAASGDRAKRYVASLLETSSGTDEAFETASLPALFDELCQSALDLAQANGVRLLTQNNLKGAASIQKERLRRALCNVAQNAIEHTPAGGRVYLEGRMTDGGWQVAVRDEGPGFSKAALRHATERLWRGDAARVTDGHHGLGLWFASEVIKAHDGRLTLCNDSSGGMVTAGFRTFKMRECHEKP